MIFELFDILQDFSRFLCSRYRFFSFFFHAIFAGVVGMYEYVKPRLREKISQTCGELRSCYCGVCWRLLLCNSTTNWKNNSSLGLRMMENGFYRLGDHYKQDTHISPYFPRQVFLKISVTCNEPRSR